MDAKIKSDINAIAKAYEQKFDPSAGGGQGAYKTISTNDFAGGAIPAGTSDKTYGGFLTAEAKGFRVCAPLMSSSATSCNVESSTCYCKTSTQGAGSNFGYTPGGAAAGDFSYRVPVTIKNNSSGALTNFQVAVSSFNTQTLIDANKMKSDCSDLRVTDSNGAVIPYWIEIEPGFGCRSSNTLVWVKPASLATGDNTIYFYYGNTTATDAADANAVFELYDDFNDNSISGAKWTVADQAGGLITTETGGVLRRSGTTSQSDKWSSFTSVKLIDNYRVTEFKIRLNTVSVNDAGVSMIAPNGIFLNNASTIAWRWERYTGSSWTDSVNSSLTTVGSSGAFSKIKYVNKPTGGMLIYENDTLKVTGTQVTAQGTSKVNFGTVARKNPSTYSVDIDDVRVRKYASSDPVASIGPEQAP